jgi:hypothetical protein
VNEYASLLIRVSPEVLRQSMFRDESGRKLTLRISDKPDEYVTDDHDDRLPIYQVTISTADDGFTVVPRGSVEDPL